MIINLRLANSEKLYISQYVSKLGYACTWVRILIFSILNPSYFKTNIVRIL